jgi:hypothetical protein
MANLPPTYLTPMQPRANPEDMFTPQENYARNQQWAKAGPYVTQLTPGEESEFQQWLRQSGLNQREQLPESGYDIRGFWKGMKQGDPRALAAINPNVNEVHYPDVWKTPYGSLFSNESIYAQPNAPRWTPNDNYVLPNGWVILRGGEQAKWYGLPKK